MVRYQSLLYQAASWTMVPRVVAKVEFHFDELFPRIGFIVTRLNPCRRTPFNLRFARTRPAQPTLDRQAGRCRFTQPRQRHLARQTLCVGRARSNTDRPCSTWPLSLRCDLIPLSKLFTSVLAVAVNPPSWRLPRPCVGWPD